MEGLAKWEGVVEEVVFGRNGERRDTAGEEKMWETRREICKRNAW